MALCYQIERNVNVMIDFTNTSCIPAGGKGGALSFILNSSRPVFSVEKAKMGWLLAAIAATGAVLNDNKSAPVDEILMSDIALMKQRIWYRISADTAKSLQRRVKADQIDLETMYAEISKSMSRVDVPLKLPAPNQQRPPS
jgi:hypothetical protein